MSEKDLEQFGVHVNAIGWFGPKWWTEDTPMLPLDELIDSIVELGVKAIRVPLNWRQLDAGRSDYLRRRDQVCAVFDALPEDVSITSSIGVAPEAVAADYFDDRSVLGEAIAAFLGEFVPSLPRVTDWEVWNESNASDFYLSRPDPQSAHRPWTGIEYVEDLAVPALRCLRSLTPTSTLCAATFAENGIVGHNDRPPALANSLVEDNRFSSMRSPDPHGQFYFIPDFAHDVFEAFDSTSTSGELAKAFACHPYPYFQIWQTRDSDLANKTRSLVSQLSNVMDQSPTAASAELWITETGARSFDVLDANRNAPEIQRDYVESLLEAPIDPRVSRLFIYQLRDYPQDLRQEKTFGLFDHRGRRKPAFHVVRDRAAASGGPSKRVVERFAPSGDSTGRVRADTDFAFVAPDKDERSLVFAGRQPGNWIELESGISLEATNVIAVEVDIEQFDEWRDLSITLAVHGIDRTRRDLACVELRGQRPTRLQLPTEHEALNATDHGQLRRVAVCVTSSEVLAFVGHTTTAAAIRVPADALPRKPVAPILRLTALGPPRTSVSIGRVRFSSDERIWPKSMFEKFGDLEPGSWVQRDLNI